VGLGLVNVSQLVRTLLVFIIALSGRKLALEQSFRSGEEAHILSERPQDMNTRKNQKTSENTNEFPDQNLIKHQTSLELHRSMRHDARASS